MRQAPQPRTTPDLAKKINMIRDHGQAKKYYHDIEGYNGRLDAFKLVCCTRNWLTWRSGMPSGGNGLPNIIVCSPRQTELPILPLNLRGHEPYITCM